MFIIPTPEPILNIQLGVVMGSIVDESLKYENMLESFSEIPC